MTIDSLPQPCPRCLRDTVLVTNRAGRQWLHVGTWRLRCDRVVDTLDTLDSSGAGQRTA